ncbi:MAG TPA: alpha/beta hydrolase [Gemmatimonadaceae bacterium]|nr:alpha/beta hydrolase [Gemmatimonadaceae bacterium]
MPSSRPVLRSWPRVTLREALRVALRVALLGALFGGAARGASAQQASAAPAAASTVSRRMPTMPLWSHRAPGALGDSTVDVPTVTPYLPPADRATGAAAVILAGGGYLRVAVDKEGIPAARWLNSLGVAAFVVQYRLGPRYHHPAMLQDAQRAVRLVRARAAGWGVDPHRVGVVGFSAGGHLASTLATHSDAGAPAGTDAVERESSRPDFTVLVYPVITMEAGVTHANSRTRLLGEHPSPELVRLLSNETQVTEGTPPAFIVASADDRTVPVENALRYFAALRAHGVAAELHVFGHGRHGFGLAPEDPVLSQWPALCAAWLRSHGWLDAAYAAPSSPPPPRP